MTSLQTSTPAIHLPEDDRATFVMRVYQHVLAAIVAFAAITALFVTSGIAERIYDFFSGGAWLLMLGLFMVGQWFVSNAVSDMGNPARQYAGLFGSSFIYAVLFAPMMHYVYNIQQDSGDVAMAGVVTAIGVGLLSVVAFTTRKDLSFLRPLVMWGFGAALLLIIAAVLFDGLHLGTWFSVGMIALSGAAILYQTQNIIRRFPSQAYVAGAVQLFGSIMTMFYYVLRIFISRD